MESGLFFLAVVIVLYALYRLLSRRNATPEGRVRDLLRRHHAFQRLGLPERECLYRQLASRMGWRNLPPAFLADLVARLETKENVFRFVSLAEDHRFHTEHLPAIAAVQERAAALRQVALWLGAYGKGLHKEERYKESEFVQKLALQLQPEASFTLLPLAATYCRMERYSEAAPLFHDGLARFDADGDNALLDAKAAYEEMYAACKKIKPKERTVTPH